MKKPINNINKKKTYYENNVEITSDITKKRFKNKSLTLWNFLLMMQNISQANAVNLNNCKNIQNIWFFSSAKPYNYRIRSLPN